MQLSQSQLNTLRTFPQGTKLWLSVYLPATLLACRVNNSSIARGARTIAYDSVTSGSYLNIDADVTCMIGTAPGQDDIGRIRVKSATATELTVAENTISWADNHYLTVIQQVDINAIFPRIINDPNNATNVIFYKDYDIAYTNQNTVLGSFVNMGSHRAAFRESGNISLYYTSTGTYNVNGDSLTYLWSFEGGTPTGSTAGTPGYVSYSTPGHYRTKLTVFNASGGSDVSYRYVSIYDRPENGTSIPILKWQLNQFSGSRSEGGYTVGLTVRENINQIQPNAIVVIFADDFYGTVDGSLGGNQQNSEKIVFVGYILGDTINYDYKDSSVEFSVGSVSDVMKSAEGFSCSLETKVTPATWFEIADMSVAKAMYHYLRWHSTVLKTTDFQYTGDDRRVQYFDADRSGLYEAISNFVSSGLVGQLVSDRQGKLWAEILPEGRSNPLDFPVAMTLLRQDWLGSPSLTEKRTEEVSFLEMGGIAWSGVNTGTFAALLTNAPDTAPLYRGKVEKVEGLILTGQDQLNSIAGNRLATKNSRFPEIGMNLAGNYRNLDIAPLEIIRPFIEYEDTIRNVRIQDESYRPESMTWSYDSEKGRFSPEAVFRRIGTGSAGTSVFLPDVPDDGGFSQSGFSLPKIPALGLPAQFANMMTGSSCCDQLASLGLGLGTLSCKATLGSYLNALPGSDRFLQFTYASNMQMYSVPLSRFTLLNTGDPREYTLTLSANYNDQSNNPANVFGQFAVLLYDGSGASLGGVLMVLNAAYQQTGFATNSLVIYNPNTINPNYFRVLVPGASLGGIGGSGNVSCTWSNIVFEIKVSTG